jgi:exopolysaccharide biosynthesis polyprenyl glycosylphosphotransferase
MSQPTTDNRRTVPARRGRISLAATRKTPVESLFHFVLAPLTVAVVIAITSRGSDHAVDAGLLSFLLFLGTATLFRSGAHWADLLPFMGIAYAAAPPMLALAAVMLLKATTSVPGAGLTPLLVGSLASAVVSSTPRLVTRRGKRPRRPVVTALIGLPATAAGLAAALERERHTRYNLIGRIELGWERADSSPAGDVPTLGALAEAEAVVARHGIELLLIDDDAPAAVVFHWLTDRCLHLPVCVCSLREFCEDAFGRVPLKGVDASWFGSIMHPLYRPPPPAIKRSLDLLVAGVLGLVTLPLLCSLMLLVRRDGGPALFRQLRIGEGGRPFTLYKLRTMHVGSGSVAQWASPDDPRITRVGGLLRRTHLDELPQVLNVLRGDMSLVGPRPEQPEFVRYLSRAVPFYTKRHLIRPGVTGWAQVRCGYAGSDIGSSWKVSHDLFYLKHRTLLLDLVILGETLRTLVVDRPYNAPAAAMASSANRERAATQQPAVAVGGPPAIAGPEEPAVAAGAEAPRPQLRVARPEAEDLATAPEELHVVVGRPLEPLPDEQRRGA